MASGGGTSRGAKRRRRRHGQRRRRERRRWRERRRRLEWRWRRRRHRHLRRLPGWHHGLRKPGPVRYTATVRLGEALGPKVPAGCKIPIIHWRRHARPAPTTKITSTASPLTFLATCYEDTKHGRVPRASRRSRRRSKMYPDPRGQQAGLHRPLPGRSSGLHHLAARGGQVREQNTRTRVSRWSRRAATAWIRRVRPGGGPRIRRSSLRFHVQRHGRQSRLGGLGRRGVQRHEQGERGLLVVGDRRDAHSRLRKFPRSRSRFPGSAGSSWATNAACKFFKAMPGNSMISPGWTKEMSENEAPCQ